MKKGLVLFAAMLMIATTAFSADLGFKAIGVKAGMVMPEDPWETGFLIGAAVDMGEITNNLSLVPSISYWKSGYDFGTFELSLSNIQIAGDVHYHLANVKGLYGGAGLSLNFVTSEFPGYTLYGFSEESTSNTETEFGIGLLAGYEMNIGGMKAFAEGKYNLISNLNTLELAIGVYFDMTK